MIKNMITFTDGFTRIWGSKRDNGWDRDESLTPLSKGQKAAWMEQLQTLTVRQGWSWHSYVMVF